MLNVVSSQLSNALESRGPTEFAAYVSTIIVSPVKMVDIRTFEGLITALRM